MAINQTELQQQIQNLPPYLTAAFQDAAAKALELSRLPYRPYDRGLRVAPLPERMNQSLNLAENTGSYLPHLTSAAQYSALSARGIPGNYEAYMDPYQESILRNISAQGRRAYKERIMPELDARYIRLGQYGSSRHAKMASNAARELQREVLNQQEDSMAKNYQQAIQALDSDRSRALEGANIASRMGVMGQAGHLTDIQTLREAAGLEHEQNQRNLDFAYEQWKESQRYPYERLQHYFSILKGTPIVPSTYIRSEFSRPNYSMHRQDWRNVGERLLSELLQGRG